MTQLIIIGCYLFLLLFLGVFSSRLFKGTSKDYMLASHSIGPFLLLMSLFGTTMTAFALVGSTGKAFERGVGTYGLMASSSASHTVISNSAPSERPIQFLCMVLTASGQPSISSSFDRSSSA